jgi:hypothetical protein
MPRIGSLGMNRDLDQMLRMACYAEPVKGHAYEPPAEVAERLDMVDPFPAGSTVPFSPRCAKCRSIAKRGMERRGLTREQIQRLFRTVGATWSWVSDEKTKARRESDKGVLVPDDRNGGLVLESTLQERERRHVQRITRNDAKPQTEVSSGVRAAQELLDTVDKKSEFSPR